MHVDPHGDLFVVMGVAGAGKTTVGRALAARLGLPYADADEFHPEANVAKMSGGLPLDDDDRKPWLAAIGGWLAEQAGGGVVSCSALRRAYRDALRGPARRICFVHLAGPVDVVTHRVASRTDHFMPASLVTSQFTLLEPLADDEEGLTVPLDWPVDQIITHVTEHVAASGHLTARTTSQGAVS